MKTYSAYNWLRTLVNIDSPTGYTDAAAEFIQTSLSELGYSPRLTPKGGVLCDLSPAPTVGLAAHVDTLGLMVAGFYPDGRLRFTPLGGLLLPTAEGEYVTIHTLSGRTFSGTVLLNNPSVHVNQKTKNEERSSDTMHIRLDERVSSPDDVKALGIRVGDIIALDPRYKELDNGFIVSRFMDNKISCYVLYEVARRTKEEGLSLPVQLYFSNYEEVGHGGAGVFDESISDLLVLDMGVVGEPCTGNEFACSICVKDSSGPYDYRTRKKLIALAEEGNIAPQGDVYPFYSSDGTAALRAGMQARVGLIGPGVAASHGIERTHKDGVEASINLTMAYCKTFA